ncbi:hypothetical protein ABIA38_001604 [Embleya sp. AB8]
MFPATAAFPAGRTNTGEGAPEALLLITTRTALRDAFLD